MAVDFLLSYYILLRFNYNFGIFGWLDKIHGTYQEPKDVGVTTNGVKKNVKKVENKKRK